MRIKVRSPCFTLMCLREAKPWLFISHVKPTPTISFMRLGLSPSEEQGWVSLQEMKIASRLCGCFKGGQQSWFSRLLPPAMALHPSLPALFFSTVRGRRMGGGCVCVWCGSVSLFLGFPLPWHHLLPLLYALFPPSTFVLLSFLLFCI